MTAEHKSLEITASRMAYLRNLVRKDIRKRRDGVARLMEKQARPDVISHAEDSMEEGCRLLAEMVRQTGPVPAREKQAIRELCGWRDNS